ncbi:MAG: family 16 glycoside hydrolase [Planctomycetota bacterium]
MGESDRYTASTVAGGSRPLLHLHRRSLVMQVLLAVLAVLASQTAPAAAEKIPVLVAGGANNHWWQRTTPSLAEILEESGKFAVTTTDDPATTFATPGELGKYAAVVLDYNGPRWGAAAEEGFLAAVESGLGVVVHHAANNAFEGWREYEEICALLWRAGTGHGRFHAFDVKITDRDHPITRDLPDLVAHPDELYHRLVHLHGTSYRVLATAWSDPETGGTGKDEPMILVKEWGKGRIFHTPLGHVWPEDEATTVSHRDPAFRELIVRGTEWAASGDVTPAVRVNTLTAAEAEAGWELLFDGKSTDRWRGYQQDSFPARGWEIDGDALHVIAGAGSGDVVTRDEYRDFEFAFDWKVSAGANSGVMYRVSEDYASPWHTGPEYQVFDDGSAADGKDPKTSAGALYALIAAAPHLVRPAGEWNAGRILLVGNHLEHWLNGVRVVSAEMNDEHWNGLVTASKFAPMPAFGREKAGRIDLQDHGYDVWYRNLKIRRLDPDTARETALFDGQSLAGWTHHLEPEGKLADVWSVTPEGVLVCRGNPAGYIRTEQDFTNYTLRLQWRFDPVTKQAGNSGVLLRMIGPDQVWPRSVEAQLQSGAAGDFWNIEEFPMQAVHARTNGRNTKATAVNENPVGEWNQYEITVWHGHVVLRVNGQILNQAWDCLEVPGRICLQSEGAEIHFREIRLMPLR